MADDERNAEVGSWLEVEPLDDVTRRRLVSAALRETETAGVDPPAPARPSRTWRWLAAAAAVVIVAVGTLAVVSSGGGDDTQTASRGDRTPALSPKAVSGASAPDVGDFGNLDDATNLAALRAALGGSFAAASAAPEAAAGASSDSSRSTTQTSPAGCLRGTVGTVVAQGSGTLDGRPVTVLLIEGADGTRSLGALFVDSCEIRDLGSG